MVIRHGQSEANVSGLIISQPETGIKQYGLTELGRQHVHQTLTKYSGPLNSTQQIYSSDFLRARQTAEVVADQLGVPIVFDHRLRERSFGDLEGQSNENYQKVWQADSIDPNHTKWQVESVQQVADRMLRFIDAVDRQTINQTFLIVSHGDPLQILLTATNGADLATHRKLEPLQTAEMRSLPT